MLGGPALFLAGLALFKSGDRARSPCAPPVIAIGVLAVLGAVAAFGADRLVVMVCATLVIGVDGGSAQRPPTTTERRRLDASQRSLRCSFERCSPVALDAVRDASRPAQEQSRHAHPQSVSSPRLAAVAAGLIAAAGVYTESHHVPGQP